MDDGSHTKYHNKKNGNYSVFYNFSTHSFSFKDQLRLVAALKKKFGINSTLKKDKTFFRLYIQAESSEIFVGLIKDNILPSFLYKLGL